MSCCAAGKAAVHGHAERGAERVRVQRSEELVLFGRLMRGLHLAYRSPAHRGGQLQLLVSRVITRAASNVESSTGLREVHRDPGRRASLLALLNNRDSLDSVATSEGANSAGTDVDGMSQAPARVPWQQRHVAHT